MSEAPDKAYIMPIIWDINHNHNRDVDEHWGNGSWSALPVESPLCKKYLAATPAREAADDLLEALELFVAYDEADDDDGVAMMLNYARAIEAARAAIAKARGQA